MIPPNFLPIFLDSKSISNLLVLLLEVTYLIWGSLNKDSLKSSYNRWVTKPSSHTSNFLRCSLYSFQFFFFFFQFWENFHWQRICFCKIQAKLILWNCRILPFLDQTSVEDKVWSLFHGFFLLSPFLSFPLSLLFIFLLSGTRNSSILRSESSSVCDFLCKFVPKDYDR